MSIGLGCAKMQEDNHSWFLYSKLGKYDQVMTKVPSSFDRNDSVEGDADVFLGFDFTQSTVDTNAGKKALKKFQPWFGF